MTASEASAGLTSAPAILAMGTSLSGRSSEVPAVHGNTEGGGGEEGGRGRFGSRRGWRRRGWRRRGWGRRGGWGRGRGSHGQPEMAEAGGGRRQCAEDSREGQTPFLTFSESFFQPGSIRAARWEMALLARGEGGNGSVVGSRQCCLAKTRAVYIKPLGSIPVGTQLARLGA